ncbi:MAG: hypothetical protein ACYTF0_03685 [Planctomycetota bacterium]|jgi:hypothetical protein
MLLIAIVAPIIIAVVAALLQQVWYTVLVKSGKLNAEQVPFFGLLFFRGLIVALAITLGGAIYFKTQTPLSENDPLYSEEARAGIREYKYGVSAEAAASPGGAVTEGGQQSVAPAPAP